MFNNTNFSNSDSDSEGSEGGKDEESRNSMKNRITFWMHIKVGDKRVIRETFDASV